MSKKSKSPPSPLMAFEDGNGALFTGTATEIVIQMKHIEWGDTPPALEWKERVRMRASAFGIDLIFYDALSFLHDMERHGLGRMRPDFVESLSSDSTKTDESATMDPSI